VKVNKTCLQIYEYLSQKNLKEKPSNLHQSKTKLCLGENLFILSNQSVVQNIMAPSTHQSPVYSFHYHQLPVYYPKLPIPTKLHASQSMNGRT
jgi:hypothetical protein